jgi:hypothetical protein
MAIASLVLSLVGFAGLAFIGPILGVIFGHLALKEIKDSPGVGGGQGLAQAGLIIGWIGMGLRVLGGVAVLVVLLVFGDVFATPAGS